MSRHMTSDSNRPAVNFDDLVLGYLRVHGVVLVGFYRCWDDRPCVLIHNAGCRRRSLV